MKWISVNERLPNEKEGKKYLGWFLVAHQDHTRPELSRYDGDEGTYEHGWKYAWDYDITHWRELPELPDG